MNNKKECLKVISFYRFVSINNKSQKKSILDSLFSKTNIKGTILLADEGINGSISGFESEIFKSLKQLRDIIKINKINLKINDTNFIPFNKMKIRLKKEIVSLGKKGINVNKLTGEFIHPSEWNNILSNKEIKLIDVRNPYEIKIGKFSNAIDPLTKNYRQFPNKFKNMKIKKDDTIAMYCTGGIRCEKASAYLKKEGYKKVLQLEGGVLNYFDYYKHKQNTNMWEGECFVFDQRVAIKKNFKKGSYEQCYGCRSPITKEERKSKYYIKGVSCSNCYNVRTEKQKNRSTSRQIQLEKRNTGI